MNGRKEQAPQAVEASIDWLTITYRDRAARQEAHKLITIKMQQAQRDGWEQREWSSMGFDGVSVGGYSWGERVDVDMVRISGGAANEAWKAFYDLGGNVTRLDAAVTVSLYTARREWASREYGRLSLSMDGDSKRRKYSIVQSTGGGETLYVGSRSSRWFGRLYDKGVEEGTSGPGYIWRYEVEAKEDAASALARDLRRHKSPEAFIATFVHGWFGERHVRGLFDPSLDPVSIAIIQKQSTVEQKLYWLTSQVAPSVAWLRERGELIRVLDALGLDHSVLKLYNERVNKYGQREGVEAWELEMSTE